MKFDTQTVAVVTGAASGIGLAIATALAGRGVRVAMADIAVERVREAAAPLGDHARAYACDVTDRAALEAFAAEVRRDFGPVDLLFANAGVVIGGKLVDMDSREMAWLYDVNVMGMIETYRAFHPLLAERAAQGRPARVVFTGSENSVGLPLLGPAGVYNSTKHAMLGIADALREENEGTGIGVSILCPGVTATRMWDSRAARQERYGGPTQVADEQRERVTGWLASAGQDPALTARICLDGIAGDEFIIIAHPAIREIAERRQAQITAALDQMDERLAAYAAAPG